MNNIDAVILAGGTGDTMYPLTSQKNKHFLPIQGRPLISYSLDLVLNSFLKNVIIVVNENNESKVHHYVHSKYKHPRRSKVKITMHRANEFHTLIEVLSEMITQYKIKRDFLLIYGDVVTNTPLTDFLDTHYMNQNDITCGMLDKTIAIAASKKVKIKNPINVDNGSLLVMYSEANKVNASEEKNAERYRMMGKGDQPKKENPKKKGLKKMEDMEPRKTVGVRDMSLIKIVSKENLKNKGLGFKVNLLQQKREFEMRGDLSLANVFLFSKKVFPILVHLTEKFRSLSEELIPFIIDYQSNPKLLRYYGKKGAIRLMRERQLSSNNLNPNRKKFQSEIINMNISNDLLEHQNLSRKRNIASSSDQIETNPNNKMFGKESGSEWYSSNKLDENEQLMFSEFQTLLGSESNLCSEVQNHLSSLGNHQESSKNVKVGCHVFESYYKRINSEKEYKQVAQEALGLGELFGLFGPTSNSHDTFQFTSDNKKKLGLGSSIISSLTQFSDIDSCKIKNCLIGNGVRIGKNCVLENSIILEGTVIGDGSVVKDSCIGANSLIQQDCELIKIVLGEANLVRKGKKFEDDVLNMPQDNSNLLQPIEFVETRSSRKYSHMS
jgi:ADP-glucose pyrophosphorylase